MEDGQVSITPQDNSTQECIADIGELAFRDIFIDAHYAQYMAIGIPIIAGLGVVCNLFAVWVNQYRKLTGISIILLNAMMIIDCGFLLSMVFMYAPRGHLAIMFDIGDCAARDPGFWAAIDYAQRMYVVVHPVVDLARVMVVWFTLAYTFEQYGALFHQARMSKMSKDKSAGMKIIVILFNLTIILSLIHFFKFVRKESLYGRVDHLKVCLSDVYRAPAYTNYDIYIYYGAFVAIPWFLILIAVIRICVEFFQRRREKRRSMIDSADTGISLIMKEARSGKIVITISIIFLLCYGVVDILFSFTVEASGEMYSNTPCYLVPMDRRFALLRNGPTLEVVYTAFQLIYSSLKFPICYVAGKTFRQVMHRNLNRIGVGLSSCCSKLARMWSSSAEKQDRHQQRQHILHDRKSSLHSGKTNTNVAIVTEYDNRTYVPEINMVPRYGSNTRDEDKYQNHNRTVNKQPRKATASQSQNSEGYRERSLARPYVIHSERNVPIMWESHV